MKRWLKISFNSALRGTAKVARTRRMVPGQWYVMDMEKDPDGYIPLFQAGTFEECNDWINRERDTEKLADLKTQVAALERKLGR